MIDVTQQLRDVDRRVGSRSIESGPARTVTISQTYRTDLDDLWDACTKAERLLLVRHLDSGAAVDPAAGAAERVSAAYGAAAAD